MNTTHETPGASNDPHRASAGAQSSQTIPAHLSVTLPWPPKELSPNFRTRSTRWIARVRKEYRAKVAETAWQRGVQPGRGLRLERIIFHPPTANTPDDDNIANRFKAGRDGLADAMGVDDQEFNDVPKEIGAVVKGGAVVALLSETPA